jgi:hypothetical protein
VEIEEGGDGDRGRWIWKWIWRTMKEGGGYIGEVKMKVKSGIAFYLQLLFYLHLSIPGKDTVCMASCISTRSVSFSYLCTILRLVLEQIVLMPLYI